MSQLFINTGKKMADYCIENKEIVEFMKKGIKVGIVDDHIQTAVSISNSLEYCGIKTYQAYSVEDALNLNKNEEIKVWIVDSALFQDNGLDKKFPGKKIIIVSSGSVKLKDKNIVGILKKPFDVNDLFKLLKKVV